MKNNNGVVGLVCLLGMLYAFYMLIIVIMESVEAASLDKKNLIIPIIIVIVCSLIGALNQSINKSDNNKL